MLDSSSILFMRRRLSPQPPCCTARVVPAAHTRVLCHPAEVKEAHKIFDEAVITVRYELQLQLDTLRAQPAAAHLLSNLSGCLRL